MEHKNYVPSKLLTIVDILAGCMAVYVHKNATNLLVSCHLGCCTPTVVSHSNSFLPVSLPYREYIHVYITLKSIYTFVSGSVQVKRASLVDSRTAVNDVKFAPRHLGLLLVCACVCMCVCVWNSCMRACV